MSGEHSGHKSSQAVAVCGESRTHGDNGGMEKHSSAVRSVPTHSGVADHQIAKRVYEMGQA
jgi:hypothetical protein